MTVPAIAVQSAGLVTSVGLTAAASCAAIRAKVANPSQSHFLDDAGVRILAHQVTLDQPWRGVDKLARMATLALQEALEPLISNRANLPLLLCIAEPERPGRVHALQERLLRAIEELCEANFSAESRVIAEGRVSVISALAYARQLVYGKGVQQVLIVAVDSLVVGRTLAAYSSEGRLLTAQNSDGFMPGEAAAAILVGRPADNSRLVCRGIGLGLENSHVRSGAPLRAEGLASAHRRALEEAGCSIDQAGFRIADLSGEQYYFKEADLALSRLLRTRQEDPQIWHPAETVGNCGAAIGGICLALAHSAFWAGYAPAPMALIHLSDDAGRRASALVAEGA
jgi:3-oxoacyl-[acyl-carrier-protein] synthase-1